MEVGSSMQTNIECSPCLPHAGDKERREERFGEVATKSNTEKRLSSWSSSQLSFTRSRTSCFSLHKALRGVSSSGDSGRDTGPSRTCSESSSSYGSFFSSHDSNDSLRQSAFHQGDSFDILGCEEFGSDGESNAKWHCSVAMGKERRPSSGKTGVCRKLVDFMPEGASAIQATVHDFDTSTPSLSQDFLSLDLAQSDNLTLQCMDEQVISSSSLESNCETTDGSGEDSNGSPISWRHASRAMSLPSVAGLDALFHAPLVTGTPLGNQVRSKTCITPFGQTAMQSQLSSPYQPSSSFPFHAEISTSPDCARSSSNDDMLSSQKQLMQTVLLTPVAYGKRQHQESPMAACQQPGVDAQLTPLRFLHSANSNKRTRDSKQNLKATSPLKVGSMERFASLSSPKLNSAFGIGCKQADLIGDFSRPHCLPLLSSEGDLKRISCETLHELLIGKYRWVVGNYVIIDCRYPYEYRGGHIKGAVNFSSSEGLVNQLMRNAQQQENPAPILIFHCEFSLKRSPTMLRDLRRADRNNSGLRYPALNYPEIYLLSGGYCKFFEHCKDQCEPQNYIKMLDEAYTLEYQMFQRSRSFSEGCEPPARMSFQRHRTCLRF